ncbi:2-keto-4-pentenoate hydratase [Marinobacterium mangrovicola]|uniref:2-keto-4-pentenoate hydratase n=1 Tax=Marinobacterium mangrovicola TaxID=1476959 RepID=A0A4R1GC31_9GAMM|nr:2-keto-4-pentenoate hydratase [Marinobacterium mangrovicola]TCK04290.1 2-keto-4-pentenoate hydratase [Marinobacterium mangrovicola]
MSSSEFNAVAQQIIKARAEACAIDPISGAYPHFDMDDAYAIQKLVNAARVDDGGRVVGYKIGLTSKAVQEQLGVGQPDYGVLFADMELRQGEVLDTSGLIAPKAEGEIGFAFKNDIDRSDLTLMELQAEIDFFFPVIEIVDSVVRDWKIGIVDTIADNASSARYMIGTKTFSPRGVDFGELPLTISAPQGEIKGVGRACLGNPLYATHWLVKKLIELDVPVKRGQIVLSGAMAPMVPITPNSEIAFDFEGLERLVLTSR